MSQEIATLTNLRDGRAALERARALGEIREIKKMGDAAAAAKRFAEAQGMSEEAKRYAAEMELDAKRYLGEALAERPKHPPGPPPKIGSTPEPISVVPAPSLEELGVTKKQSHEAQKIASIPEADYEQFKSDSPVDRLNTNQAVKLAPKTPTSKPPPAPIQDDGYEVWLAQTLQGLIYTYKDRQAEILGVLVSELCHSGWQLADIKLLVAKQKERDR